MPTSHLYQINEIMELIIKTDPRRILDVGIGFGKYGFLSREYLELWDSREKYSEWTRTIDGIEAFEGYITPVHRLIYNQIFIGDATKIINTLKQPYDLLLLIDVLEHLDYEPALQFLQDALKVSRNLIISTPHDIGIQKDAFGNVFETHRFQWLRRHFEQFPNKTFVPHDSSLIVYIGLDVEKVRKTFRRKILDNFTPLKRLVAFLRRKSNRTS